MTRAAVKFVSQCTKSCPPTYKSGGICVGENSIKRSLNKTKHTSTSASVTDVTVVDVKAEYIVSKQFGIMQTIFIHKQREAVSRRNEVIVEQQLLFCCADCIFVVRVAPPEIWIICAPVLNLYSHLSNASKQSI